MVANRNFKKPSSALSSRLNSSGEEHLRKTLMYTQWLRENGQLHTCFRKGPWETYASTQLHGLGVT